MLKPQINDATATYRETLFCLLPDTHETEVFFSLHVRSCYVPAVRNLYTPK